MGSAVIAALTVAIVGTLREVVQSITLYQSTTASTVFVMVIITVLAENQMLVTMRIVLPDTISTVSTDAGVFLRPHKFSWH